MGDMDRSFRMYRLGNCFAVELPPQHSYVILLGYFNRCDCRPMWTSAKRVVRIPPPPDRVYGIVGWIVAKVASSLTGSHSGAGVPPRPRVSTQQGRELLTAVWQSPERTTVGRVNSSAILQEAAP